MHRPLGAVYLGDRRCHFTVWAPKAETVEVRLLGEPERSIPLAAGDRGYWTLEVDDVDPGARYFFRLDGDRDRPDPASRHQPEGVHGPSEVVDPSFDWTDGGWGGRPLFEYVLYEIHVGTFTAQGTFEAAIERLDELADLGVTAVEIMPVARFPGGRNWGYDGVSLWAPQSTYGGPRGLMRLVDACHARGLAVVLDVVYNHLGPEGNYLGEFGPYFTERYQTPWGAALNFDDADSDEVRAFFVGNALHWIDTFHIDGLRLDAVHAIFDQSARRFLAELGEAVHERGERLRRKTVVIAESDLNDPRLIRAPEVGGDGLDAQWCDDLHHAVHALVTGERQGYYEDFGAAEHVATALSRGYVYAGERSTHRRRRHGGPPGDLDGKRFVVFGQNHDQVGNRMMGERLASLVPFGGLKVAAGTILLSPFVPLLFMGEEWGESAPFQYFVSHGDPDLVEAVRAGRADEFAAFQWQGTPPDPQAEETFRRSHIDPGLAAQGHHAGLRRLYRDLLRLRRERPALGTGPLRDSCAQADEAHGIVSLRRRGGGDEVLAILHYGAAPVEAEVPVPPGSWRMLLDSEDPSYKGAGRQVPSSLASRGNLRLSLRPFSFIVLQREE